MMMGLKHQVSIYLNHAQVNRLGVVVRRSAGNYKLKDPGSNPGSSDLRSESLTTALYTSPVNLPERAIILAVDVIIIQDGAIDQRLHTAPQISSLSIPTRPGFIRGALAT